MTVRPDEPLFFLPNRVWRCYLGGQLLDRMQGVRPERDGSEPEDWIASTTPAGNPKPKPREGISRVLLSDGTPGPWLDELLARRSSDFLGSTGSGGVRVLCKFLDSAIRLPVQVHPDRPFARKHYNSPVGKTETWFLLDTRTPAPGAEAPYLYMGFKPGVDATAFGEALKREDVPTAAAMLHRIPAKAGEGWFIPGGVPHAIGPGCLILEVQEPSDLVIEPERHVGTTTLTDAKMWGQLDPDTALTCFDYASAGTEDAIRNRLCIRPRIIAEIPAGRHESLVDRARTDCFRIERLVLNGPEFSFAPTAPWMVGMVTSGAGRLWTETGADRGHDIRAGGAFLIPAGVRECRFRVDAGPLTVFLATADPA